MKPTITICLMLIILTSFSQTNTAILDQNNVSANLSDDGLFFNNQATATAGYEVPKGSGKHSIYSSGFWMGGMGINGDIKLAAAMYNASGQDFWPGPTEYGAGTIISPNPYSETIWAVTKVMIDNHILNYSSPGYIVPSEIETWPAHGDMSVGMDYYMAPFVDVNADGHYVPEDGDYPCIKGDEAVFMILNDMGGIHATGANPVGVEMRVMFYQFSSLPDLQQTTFIDLELLNRGTQTVYDFYVSYFLDADIGYSGDDYFGTDSTRNLLFTYNGDAFDEDNGGSLGYGQAAPALGVICLTQDASSMGNFTNGSVYPETGPTTPSDYLELMKGNWLDGNQWTDNNGDVTNFMFPGDPNNGSSMSEFQLSNSPGDRRMLLNLNMGILEPLVDTKSATFAIIHASDTSNLTSVSKLFEQADFTQNFYDNLLTPCASEVVSIEEETTKLFEISPNPSDGEFTIYMSESLADFQLLITDVYGKVVLSEQHNGLSSVDVLIDKPAGVYFVSVYSNGGITIEKIIIQ